MKGCIKMKKLFTAALVLALAVSMSLTAGAAGFVSSPTNNPAPELDEPVGGVEITPYSDREDLPAEEREDLEGAYKNIIDSTDLSDLVDELKDIADELDIPAGNIAASDLFDITYVGEGTVKITLNSDTLEHFVGLMVYEDGKWTLVDDARVENGKLIFATAISGPYAVLVDAGKYTKPPKTGDDNSIALYACIMVASALAFVVVNKKARQA